MVIAADFELPHTKERKPYIYIYINKDWKSIHNKYKAYVNTHKRKTKTIQTVVMSRRPNAKRTFSVTNYLVMEVH
jgi:hypothetical protein